MLIVHIDSIYLYFVHIEISIYISEREKGKCIINNFNFSENIICESQTAEVIRVCIYACCLKMKIILI